MTRIIKFTKMHGAGNDYIYVDTTRYPIGNPEKLSKEWSALHTGIGSDGLVLIGRSGKADFSMRIFNADGSEAKMCGNASRCIGNEILMYLRKSSNKRQESSIDEPLNTDCDGNELLLSDVLGTDGNQVGADLEQAAEKNMLLEAVGRLSARERQIMELRFGLSGGAEHTQKEVADMIGISQSYISRLEKRIIKRLKGDLERIS